jgi:predicted amidohydrolase YtcJ
MLGSEEVPVLHEELESYFSSNKILNYGNHMLKVASIKLFLDGALGSRGAAFYEPYEDDPDNTGLLRISPDYITKVSKAALKTGMQVNTHCIGIRANRLCLEAYREAFNEFPDTDHRFRIVHAQVVRPEEIQMFADLNVIPAMQPIHCTADMHFVEERIGKDRATFSYAWRSFLDAGRIIPCGSDFPVESANPLYGIYAAITRQDQNGKSEQGWHSEQCMTLTEAIKGYTIGPAYAAKQEDILGSVEVGKLADLTIVDHDLFEIEPIDILSTRILATVVGGQVKYLKPEK